MEKHSIGVYIASFFGIAALLVIFYRTSFFLAQSHIVYFISACIAFICLVLLFFFKKGNQLFKKQNDDYKHIFYELPLPAIIVDAATLQIINVNNAAIQLYGFSRNYFISSRLKALFYSKENYFVFRRKMMRGILTGFTWEHRNIKNDKIAIQPIIQEITYKQKPCLLAYFPVHSNTASNLSIVSSNQDYDKSKYISIRHFSVS